MAQKSGDDKDEPSLELPTLRLPWLRRRSPNGEADAEPMQPPVEVRTPPKPEEGPPPRTDRPTPSARVVSAVTGLVVGVTGAAATYGAMAGCEAVRGVSTCGGAPGFFILVAILVLMILLGSLVLKAFGVPDAGSTSFLAVGVIAVVAMLVLLDVIFSVWMFVVVPLLGALSYLLAHWVTSRYDDGATGRRDWT